MLVTALQAFEESDALRLIQAEVISRNADLKSSEIQIQITNWAKIRSKFMVASSSGSRFEMVLNPGVRLLGNAVVPFKITAAHEQVQWINLQVHVQAQVPLCMSTRTIPAKTLVTANMFEIVTKNVSALPSGFVRSCADLINLESALFVPSGTVLYARQFRKVPQIRSQESVTLILEKEGVHLKMEGQALEDGYDGQVINVKNVRSGKRLKGRVVGYRSVEIVP